MMARGLEEWRQKWWRILKWRLPPTTDPTDFLVPISGKGARNLQFIQNEAECREGHLPRHGQCCTSALSAQ